MQLIEARNPEWVDLYPYLCGDAPDPRLPLAEDGEGSVAAFLKRLEAGDIDGE